MPTCRSSRSHRRGPRCCSQEDLQLTAIDGKPLLPWKLLIHISDGDSAASAASYEHISTPLTWAMMGRNRSLYCVQFFREADVTNRTFDRTLFTSSPCAFSIGAYWCQALSGFSVGLVLISVAGSALLFALRPSHDGIRRMGRNDLPNVLAVSQTTGTRHRTDSPQPSSLLGHHSTSRRNQVFSSLVSPRAAQAAAALAFVQRNSVLSAHMRCMITAIRRATATIALFIPRWRAIFMPPP